MKGAEDCANNFNTSIIGGDTKENQNVVLTGTAFGKVKKSEFMSRKGVKPGDIAAVTGKLGGAGAGYFALKNQIDDKKLVKNLFEPNPKIKEGISLAKLKDVSSCMDISDGLSSSLYQLKDLNKIGFKIDKNLLPISEKLISILKKHTDLDVYKYALHFGGDYELLLTIPPDKFEKAKKTIEKTGNILTKIGTATSENKIILKDNQIEKKLENKGYEHFKTLEF
jgi:thiamine-monophosphate kinase